LLRDKLKELREKEKMSQAELAEKIFVSRSAVAKWEQGRGMPSEASLQELCKLFNITTKELLDEKEEKIYAFDYKRERRTVILIIISIIIFVIGASYVSYMFYYVETNKPTDFNPGFMEGIYLEVETIDKISMAVGDSYTIDFENIDANFHEFDIIELYDPSTEEDNQNSVYYTVKGNTIKALKSGVFFVYVKAIKKDKFWLKGHRFGEVLKVYCYDKAELKEISTVEDLMNINNDLSEQYILNNDIDLSGVTDFKPIGYLKSFSGVFINPNNYIIKNLTLDSSNCYSSGLFYYISNALIENIILENVVIYNEEGTVGAISASSLLSLVSNCKVVGEITGVHNVGGLIGSSRCTEISECTFVGTVSQINFETTFSSPHGAGGLVGYLDNESGENTIYNNKVIATIESINAAGEIAGYVHNSYRASGNQLICKLYAPLTGEYGDKFICPFCQN